jgi:hypothetical protein
MVTYNSATNEWTLAAKISEIRKTVWNAKDPFPVMVRGYLECMLWSSTDMDTEEHLDENYSIDDISDEFFESSVIDCAKLFSTFRFSDSKYVGKPGNEFDVHSYAGHDFWLTRAGHGAGFWEKSDWEEDFGEQVTAHIKKDFPDIDPYVGDDYKIYAM